MNSKQPVLLAVDDRQENLFIIEQVLGEHLPSCLIITALNAGDAIELAEKHLPDGILADVTMPEIGGVELCRLLKANPVTAHIPVVLMTAHKSASKQYAAGLEAGAEDFITKPIDNLELVARLRVMLRLKNTSDRLVEAHRELSRKESFDLLHAVFEGTSDAIYVKDTEGRYLLANKKTLESLGKKQGEVIGKTDHELLNAQIADKLLANDRQAIETKQAITVDEFPTDDPERIWHSTKTPIFDENGTITSIVGVSRNISEHRKYEKQKAMLESQLRQSQKMEAIGTMAGGIAHHFNNILSVILGFGDMAKDEIPKDQRVHGYIEKLLSAANRAKDLVRHIVTFSQQNESSGEYVNACALLHKFLPAIKVMLPPTIIMTENIPTDLGVVKINRDQFQKVLSNLCTNAIDAMMNGGGTLAITVENVELTAGFLLGEDNVAPGPFLKLIVSDSGVGMAPEIIDHIFDPFFTTKEVGSGDGIGLSVVYGIVRKSGGLIRVKSTVGKGSTFQVFLPSSTAMDKEHI